MARDIDILKRVFADQKLPVLDLTRGIPNAQLLDQIEQLYVAAGSDVAAFMDGVDIRNYGSLTGLPAAREIGSELLNCLPENICVGSNSSLAIFFQFVSALYFRGMPSHTAWQKHAVDLPVQVLCTVPGYDRHFTMFENMDIEMLNVNMTPDGPDLEQLTECLRNHKNIRGMIGVPTHSNPGGENWSFPRTRDVLATLRSYDQPIMLMLDDAYAVHQFDDTNQHTFDVLELAASLEMSNFVVKIGSTAKITFAGAGISFLASSKDNIAAFTQYLQGISMGGDKFNQTRHIQMFEQTAGVKGFFKKYCAPWMKQRFEQVEAMLQQHLGGNSQVSWTTPSGGYFVLIKLPNGLASTVIQEAKPIVKLTNAGATFPYGKDPENCYIRLAPTSPNEAEIVLAIEVLAACINKYTS